MPTNDATRQAHALATAVNSLFETHNNKRRLKVTEAGTILAQMAGHRNRHVMTAKADEPPPADDGRTDEPMQPAPPLVLAYGLGLLSTAVLVGWHHRGIRPDLILYADDGSESRATYRYRALVDRWLEAVGFPPITEVRYRPRHGFFGTIAEECLIKGVMPSPMYGSPAGARQWRNQPIHEFLRSWPPTRSAIARGEQFRQASGHEAKGNAIPRRALPDQSETARFEYPLRDWDWDVARCRTEIAADPTMARLARKMDVDPVPPRSRNAFTMNALNPSFAALGGASKLPSPKALQAIG